MPLLELDITGSLGGTPVREDVGLLLAIFRREGLSMKESTPPGVRPSQSSWVLIASSVHLRVELAY